MLERHAPVPQRPDKIVNLVGNERHGGSLVRPGELRAIYKERRLTGLEGKHFLVLHDLDQAKRTFVELFSCFEVLARDSGNRVVITKHVLAPSICGSTLDWAGQTRTLCKRSATEVRTHDTTQPVDAGRGDAAPYSARNVIAGSTWAARHAGSQQAMTEMPT